ncbi:MAG: Tetratricopeptide TPR_2 repeat protein [Microgenomates group bacterium GW2011_GWC1_39_12]|nr:MAG: Tetratricopeptide TPR_2 repeat protein [Microgenomates group bacterium GW2011_GWC1_39_12]
MSQTALQDQAILCALAQNWKEAIRINLQIIKQERTNIDAHNRLGYAFMKNGQPIKSKEIFTKVLKLDPYNQIAQKNLKKISLLKKGAITIASCEDISPLLFLEEPGKTKIVDCINTAPMNVLSVLTCGQKIQLVPKAHSIDVRDMQNAYIGALPDDLAFRLLKLMDAGNEYAVFVKGVSKNCVSIFIRETKRGKKLTNQPSFIGSTNYMPYQRGGNEEKKMKLPSEDEDTDLPPATEEEN